MQITHNVKEEDIRKICALSPSSNYLRELIIRCICVVHFLPIGHVVGIFIKYCYTRICCTGRSTSMQLFHGHQEDKLKCPYKGCEKAFDKPTVLTDNSVIPRQTHYACPYCMSKVELITEKNKILEVKPTEYNTVFDSPAKCAYYSGLLPPQGTSLTQDECLICPKVLQCNIRRR